MKAEMLYVIVKLGIPDLLAKEPMGVDALSNELKVHRESLCRLMRAVSCVGLFKENKNGRYELTSLSERLLRDHPDSVYTLVLMAGDRAWREPWRNLYHSIKTGEDACEYAFGMKYFDYLKKHPGTWKTFNEWMTRMSEMSASAIVKSYPFHKFKKVVDIGGGHGLILSAVLQKNPSLKGVLFDLPEVVEGAGDIMDDSVKNRCELVGGDFFEAVPEGGDLYIMQQIIHDWSDELSVKILKNCQKAMTDEGRLLIMDAVLRPGNAFDLNKFIDLQMLVLNHGGKERTEDEFRALLDKAGFKMTKVIPTASMFSIIEAVKA